jgi:hypothetical protein
VEGTSQRERSKIPCRITAKTRLPRRSAKRVALPTDAAGSDESCERRTRGACRNGIGVASGSFMQHDMLMIKPDRCFRDGNRGDVDHVVRIQMGDELIPVAAHCLDQDIELRGCRAELGVKLGFQRRQCQSRSGARNVPNCAARRTACTIRVRTCRGNCRCHPPERGLGMGWVKQRQSASALAGAIVSEVAREARTQRHHRCSRSRRVIGVAPPLTIPRVACLARRRFRIGLRRRHSIPR